MIDLKVTGMKFIYLTALFLLFCVVTLPQTTQASSCSSYPGALCVDIMKGCAGNLFPTDDCTAPQVCCAPSGSTQSCSSQGGIPVPAGPASCVGGTVVPATGLAPGDVCCVPPTCSSLGGSCISNTDRNSCTDAGGTINTVNDCANLNPLAPYCCIPKDRTVTCMVSAGADAKIYTGRCVNSGTCASPSTSATAPECSAGQICCYNPTNAEDSCVSAGGTCTDTCGDNQISRSGLFCSDEFDTCCFDIPKAPDNIGSGEGLVPCSGIDIVGGKPISTCQFCNLVELINNVMQWAVATFTIIFAIVFIVSGYRLVTSAGNTSVMESAKKMITNTIVGLLIVLASWLIIDFWMKSLLDTSYVEKFGPWNQIKCVEQPEAEIVYVGSADDAIKVYGASSPSDIAEASKYDAGDCSTETLKSMGMNDTQAQVFSCIARYESNCVNFAQSSVSSARGIFQITRGWNDKCHNLNLSSCTAAASAAGWSGGDLNCSRAFGKGGRIISGQEVLANYCNVAASNQKCNVDAALCLHQNGGYGHWTGTASSPHKNQIACVQKYAK